jgi:hypothetical protein
MDDVPTWLSILLYAIGAIASAGVLYLLMLTAMRQALREPLAELRTARRRQEDLLREISTSATYVADVADVWAESEAERRAGSEREAERRAALEPKGE